VTRLLSAVALVGATMVATPAAAQVIHVVQPGDTPTSLAVHYYGDAVRQVIIRAVNGMHAEDEVDVAIGEPMLIPERRHRLVAEGDTWADLSRQELGTVDRAWLFAQVNDTDPLEAPEPGRVIVIPYLMPLAIADGLPTTISRYYPDENMRQVARMLRRVNPNLRGRVPRGTRIVLPFAELEILAARRSEIDQAAASRRAPTDADRQDEAAQQLARLRELLDAGSFAECVELAGRISGCADLTAAQQVRLRRYLGQAYVALERDDLAEQEFRQLLTLEPDFQFDQVTTSPAVIELLDRARRPARGGGA